MELSILSKQFSPFARSMKEFERKANLIKYRLLNDKYKIWSFSNSTGGHQDVFESILNGAINYKDVKIKINPSKNEVIGSIIYVPAGWRALRDAIDLKRRGEISKLIAGPNVCSMPDEHGYIMADPAIDCCLFASEWVKEYFLSKLAQNNKTINAKIWAAGVDHTLWNPTKLYPNKEYPNVLIYAKLKKDKIVDLVCNRIQSFKETKVLSYGSHLPSEYKSYLEWADCVVYIGSAETQGLALSQAWSMNRQTFVYQKEKSKSGHNLCAPYLTNKTGRKWGTIDELEFLLSNIKNLEPRKWILENQTNEISFSNLYKILAN